MFKYEEPYFTNYKGKAMDVSGGVDAENRNIIMYNKHGKINQQWDLVYVDKWQGEPGKGQLNSRFGLYVERPFNIVSALGSHKYLDLINNRNMVIKTRNGRNTQTWYFHQQSLTIRTKLNNQSFDIQNSGRTSNMQIWSTNSGWWQLFKYENKMFINMSNGKVLDVAGSKDAEGQKVQLYGKNGGVNQQWNVVYLDKSDDEEKKGFDSQFGFYRNRPFYLRSRMPMKRIAECQGASNVYLKRWRKNVAAQQWFFDPVAKVIRSNHWKNYIMHIPGNGGQNSLRMTSSITSRWW